MNDRVSAASTTRVLVLAHGQVLFTGFIGLYTMNSQKKAATIDHFSLCHLA